LDCVGWIGLRSSRTRLDWTFLIIIRTGLDRGVWLSPYSAGFLSSDFGCASILRSMDPKYCETDSRVQSMIVVNPTIRK